MLSTLPASSAQSLKRHVLLLGCALLWPTFLGLEAYAQANGGIGSDAGDPGLGGRNEIQGRLVSVLHRSRRHADDQQQAKRVHQNVPFTPIDVFSGVIAVLATTLGGLDRLRIKDGRRWRALASCGLAKQFAQAVMDAFPDALQLPPSEVVIDDSPGRKLMWQQAPSAARTHEIEDCIENLTSGILRRTTSGFGLGHQRSEPMPLGVA